MTPPAPPQPSTARVALITGAARRVGRAIAEALAAAGYDILVHFNHSDRAAQSLVEQLGRLGRRAVAVGANLDDPEAAAPALVRAAQDRFGRLDVLINNASVFPGDGADTLSSFDAGAWERILRINLTAPVALCHHARTLLSAGGEGVVVNLCDISADRPWPNHLAYCASKAGLACMTRALARAMAPEVRVVGVAPGIAVFPEDYGDELRSRLVGKVPLERAGTPAEVGRLVRFLVTEGTYISGEVVAIDGGRGVV